MANLTRTFIKGRMNKGVDERLLPDGEYIDALNIRLGSTEESEIGVVENSKGNTKLTSLVNIVSASYPALANATTHCIGAYADSANETIYWFVHATGVSGPSNGILDMIVSYNTSTEVIRYHVVSSEKTNGATTSTLNFSTSYLISSVNLIDNLLFFTDNLNPPRFINVNRDYGLPDSTTYEDPAILEEQLKVIKKPPTSAPSINLLDNGSDEKFLEEEFLCFAYRYKYADGEYSATSPFSAPAFLSQDFAFSPEDFLNTGMTNLYNVAEINYNTGGELVVGVDILFKRADSSIIKVIQKINKSQSNLTNNSDEVYRFDKSKVYTILPESEILRLYDNVPNIAKAQTLMGNRLMYGNYKEGYDMTDSNGLPVIIDYTTELISSDVGGTSISGTFTDGTFTINSSKVISDSIVSFDLGTSNIPNPQQKFTSGARLDFNMEIEHSDFDIIGGETIVNASPRFEIDFSFTLDRDYNSASDIISSSVFQNAIGTSATIQKAPADFCSGETFTDIFNCATIDVLISDTPSNYNKNESGITAIEQPLSITSSSGSDTLSIQILATKYVHSSDGSKIVYEYYKINSATCLFTEITSEKSLHSNRDYSVGMVYMDDYGRQSNVFTSNGNTVHVPYGNSVLSNKIKVTIPSTQLPPSWATKYKFVLKADRDTYETIYSNIFFIDGNFGYILLEGENAAKVEEGDRLLLKADSGGPVITPTEITILEKKSQAKDFLGSNTNPAGVYAKVQTNSITLVDNSSDRIRKSVTDRKRARRGVCAYGALSIQESSSVIPIAGGDRITIKIDIIRHGVGGCNRKEYNFDKTFISPRQYSSFYDWFQGENIQSRIENDGTTVGTFDIRFVTASSIGPSVNTDNGSFKITFGFQADASSATEFRCRTFENCGDNTVKLNMSLDILKVSDMIVFETRPVEANPDIFFEGDETFTISGASHDSATPTLSFFNCFSFGNGIESYKIKDSVTGASFGLGNRVTSVSSEDYREAHRFADITYSGIYNDESNVNKLNEFNLGLLNFKNLEESFGVVTVLDGRETDVLVLQEDKVSYVLAGKNLLSDAAAGGAITSVPEVLGTQIARVEEYGNSLNPESYVKWGSDKFFTDSKRGAVIQLKGQGKSESMIVISEIGMRSFFRNLFIEGINTQKLGAFDPYMNEYVLSSNLNAIPIEDDCIGCNSASSGISVSPASTTFVMCVDLDNALGSSTISWAIDELLTPTGNVTISAVSGSDNATTNVTSGGASSGTFVLSKTDVSTKKVTVTFTHTSGNAVSFGRFSVGCPTGTTKKVVSIVLTDNVDANKTIHTQYKYSTQPRVSNLNTFLPGGNPHSSFFNTFEGFQGLPNVPTAGSTVTMYANELSGDTFSVNSSLNKFRYLTSNTAYTNGSASLQNLLNDGSLQELSMGGSSPEYSASFTMPSDTNTYLYLIWDFRSPTELNLCLDIDAAANACCACVCDSDECSRYTIVVSGGGTGLISYDDCANGFITASVSGTSTVCVKAGALAPSVASGNVSVSFDRTGCNCGGAVNTVQATIARFIDGNDFSRATVIASNSALTNAPATGWYSDGNVARYNDGSSTTLGPISVCPECT